MMVINVQQKTFIYPCRGERNENGHLITSEVCWPGAAGTEIDKISGVFFQPVQHNVVVIAGFEIVKDMFDFAISVNQEADAMNFHRRFCP